MSKTDKVENNESKSQDEVYAYKDIAEVEEILGKKVSEAFRLGWTMARVKNKHLRELAERSR